MKRRERLQNVTDGLRRIRMLVAKRQLRNVRMAGVVFTISGLTTSVDAGLLISGTQRYVHGYSVDPLFNHMSDFF